ncbi:Hsp20/alpha crystallin family protein [Halobacterium wangiae]|uniref:Hsp20/alpha crystallin family protein n=1 Tax=Halobacterium wangiae TaxID=2902623 RepID=UPI001E4DAEC9|nr:Hsp20/alpha crystallin family protein [Halobacterium wangiae]
MRRDDRDDPFDDIFREIERMMDEMIGGAQGLRGDQSGFSTGTHVDVHESDDTIRVIADLPGVEKDDISIQCDGKQVTISAHTDSREYDERVSLPGRVDARSGDATYNNGVLEIAFERTSDSTNIDVQ